VPGEKGTREEAAAPKKQRAARDRADCLGTKKDFEEGYDDSSQAGGQGKREA